MNYTIKIYNGGSYPVIDLTIDYNHYDGFSVLDNLSNRFIARFEPFYPMQEAINRYFKDLADGTLTVEITYDKETKVFKITKDTLLSLKHNYNDPWFMIKYLELNVKSSVA